MAGLKDFPTAIEVLTVRLVLKAGLVRPRVLPMAPAPRRIVEHLGEPGDGGDDHIDPERAGAPLADGAAGKRE